MRWGVSLLAYSQAIGSHCSFLAVLRELRGLPLTVFRNPSAPWVSHMQHKCLTPFLYVCGLKLQNCHWGNPLACSGLEPHNCFDRLFP